MNGPKKRKNKRSSASETGAPPPDPGAEVCGRACEDEQMKSCFIRQCLEFVEEQRRLIEDHLAVQRTIAEGAKDACAAVRKRKRTTRARRSPEK